MYYIAFGWNALCVSVKFIWPNLLLKATVSLLIFCLDNLPIDVSGILSPTITIFLPLDLLIFALYT